MTLDVPCNETCLFCGRFEPTISKYLSHFATCNNKENNSDLTKALKRKSDISKRGRDKLREMSNKIVESSKNAGIGSSGGKRKAGSMGPPPQRQRVDSPPNPSENLGAVTMGIVRAIQLL